MPIQLLEYMKTQTGFDIHYAEEKRNGKFSIIGYCLTNNTFYEYYECYHHGHCSEYYNNITEMD